MGFFMTFWIIVSIICILISILFYLSITQDTPNLLPNSDLEVYKDQLINVERDLSRGIITADEAERIRAEVSRRILELDKRLSAQKGIKVEFQSIPEANHFFSKSENSLIKSLDKYIKKETALY